MRVHSWFALASLLSTHLVAQNTKSVSVARVSDSGTRYFVMFAARSSGTSSGALSLPGHAFVMFGREDAATRSSTYEGYGYYSTDPNLVSFAVHLGNVPGAILNEAGLGPDGAELHSRVRATDELIVQVDRDQYDDARSILMAWERKNQYRLGTADCVTFVQDVGSALGLNLPERSLSAGTLAPEGYIAALMASVDAPVHLHVGETAYTGPVAGGFPHGHGRATFREGGVEITYEGDFVQGRRTGHGSAHDSPSSFSYEGDFVKGVFEGTGTFRNLRDGTTYTGHFTNGKPDGHGTFSDGRTFTYEGNYSHGVLEGQGTYGDLASGATYVGNFSAGRPSGQGEFRGSDFVLRGTFDAGRPTGTVTISYKGGCTYSGTYSGDAFAHGTFTAPDGTAYTGDFQANVPAGRGHWKFPDGSTFDGNFDHGRAEGDGTTTFPDGTSITSKWHEGQSEPVGRVKLPSGHEVEGHHFGGEWHFGGGQDNRSAPDHQAQMGNGSQRSGSSGGEVGHVDVSGAGRPLP